MSARKPLLHELIAVEPSLKTAFTDMLKDGQRLFTKGAVDEQLSGLIRVYKPHEDGGETLPSENKLVQRRVQDFFTTISEAFRAFVNVGVNKELANGEAKADVIVDGAVILSGMNPPSLLNLENRLNELLNLMLALPTLDPAKKWEYDTDNRYFKADPVVTVRTTKKQMPLTLAPATEKHPAQVTMVTEDILAGTWTTTALSGTMQGADKELIIKRVRSLLAAVKQARERANTTEVNLQSIADPLLLYIFGK